ncbi:MAG: hypothetical protein Kow0075_14400 [Salibacteraceae bacterium]
MNLKQVFIPVLLILAYGCSDPKAEKIDQLKERCIEVHDVAMPKMGAVENRIVELRKIAAMDSTRRNLVYEKLQALEQASEDMMDWMAGYDPHHQHTSKDSIIAYYEQQLERIVEIDKQIDKSIAEADEIKLQE